MMLDIIKALDCAWSLNIKQVQHQKIIKLPDGKTKLKIMKTF